MTTRKMSGVIAAGLLMFGLCVHVPARASAQEPAFLPAQGGPITLYGCFLRMKVADEGTKFVLVSPTLGPATSVPEGKCTSKGSEQMVELDDVHTNVHKHHLDRSKVGQWVEVTGRLEKPGHQALREVHVETYRIVPVVAVPAVGTSGILRSPKLHLPAPEVLEGTPTITTGVLAEVLPQTASSLPLVALLGLLALAAGFGMRLYRRTL